MSEFSESYHLFSTEQNDGIELLKRAWLRGFVFPERNHWVTIVPNGSEFKPNRRLINGNKGILLHLVNAEDHGWAISIYDGKKRTFHYECTWEDEIEINQDEYDRTRMLKLIDSNPYKKREVTPLELTKIFYISAFEDLADRNPVLQISELLGLEHVEWISYDYVQKAYRENPKAMQNKGIRIVNRLLSF